jgi:hypothetical protein
MDKTKLKSKAKPTPGNANEAPKDYKDPTGSKTPAGKPKNSGYDEKQPTTGK